MCHVHRMKDSNEVKKAMNLQVEGINLSGTGRSPVMSCCITFTNIMFHQPTHYVIVVSGFPKLAVLE